MFEFSVFQIIIISLLLLVLLNISIISKAKGSNLPPRPWKLPLVGNLHHLAGSLPHHVLRDMANRYGPVMGLQLGQVLAVVVSSRDAAREVFQRHDLAFEQRPNILSAEAIWRDDLGIISCPFGEYWRQMRKVCVVELLSAQRVKSFGGIREEEAWSIVELIRASQGLTPINMRDIFTSFSNSVISRAAFGRMYKGQDELIVVIKQLTTLSSGFELADLFPSLRFLTCLTRTNTILRKVQKKVDKITSDIVADHKMRLQSNAEPTREDIVDLLLKLQKSGSLKFEITNNDIKSIIVEMYAAGSESAGTTLEWAMAELLRNPQVMEKAQREIRQVLGGKPTIEDGDTQKMHYLKLVIKETFRLHPPVPLVPRESREACNFLGYDIRKRTKFIVNVWAIGRDPSLWENADCFVPERFIGSPIDYKGTNFELLPFGAGKRICPGISFAVANIELLLANLLYHFDWKLPNGLKPQQLDLTETFGVMSTLKNVIYSIATPVTFSDHHNS